MNVDLRQDWIFPNGTYIWDIRGQQIDPDSEEGQIIVRILARQNRDRIANREQKERWILETFPRDKEKQEEYRRKFGL